MKYSLFVVVAFLASAVTCQNLTQVIQTTKGPIQGITFQTVFHNITCSGFFGIPYAKPPVGDLRFKPPVEPSNWTSVVNATKEGSACPQIQPGTEQYVGDEDCLYLNLYTPVLNFTDIKTLKPVLFWIHGGGFSTGTPSKSEYGPDWFLEEDILMVATAYRFGPLGFLSLESPDATGNQGLKDQNLALRWVHENIEKFGGDPNQVTIMGESAGAASITYHMISNKSAGLFHRAIIQSGSALSPWGYKSPSASRWTGYQLAKNMNISVENDTQLLAALKNANVVDMIKTASGLNNENIPLPLRLAFVPTSETGADAFVDNCPLWYFQSGNYSHVPTLLGYTADETILYSLGLDFTRQYVQKKLLSLSGILDPTGESNLFINTVNNIMNDTVWEMIKASSLHIFSGPVDITQRALVKYNGDIPVYYYRLSYSSNYSWHLEVNPDIGGTSHADDLTLTFYSGEYPTDPNDPYNIYAKRVLSMWACFIENGDPTPANSNVSRAQWLPSGKQGLQLDIGNENFVMNNRFIVARDELVMQKYYDGLPITSECKNYPLSTLNSSSVFN